MINKNTPNARSNTTFNTETIPAVMKQLNQWLLWRLDAGRKIPLNPSYRRTDPTKGFSFNEVVSAYTPDKCDGLGFVVGGGIVCIDVDHCVADGKVSELAEQLAEELDTYVELSQSGTGLHLFFIDNEAPAVGRKNSQLEIYSHKHYIAMTGISISNSELAVLPGKTAELLEKYFPAQSEKRSDTDTKPVDELLKQLEHITDPKFRQLFYDGDTTGYTSQSEADSALLVKLAMLTGCCKEQMRELFNQSELGKRDKWSRKDYQNQQLENAISFVQSITDIKVAQNTVQTELSHDKLDISTVYSDKFMYSLAACEMDDQPISNAIVVTFYEKCKSSHIPIKGNKGIKSQITKYTNQIKALLTQIEALQSGMKLVDCVKQNKLHLPDPFTEHAVQFPSNIIFDWENHHTLEITPEGYKRILFNSINLVTQTSINVQTRRQKLTVATLKRKTNTWTYATAEREIFSSNQKITALSTEGLDVISSTADKMVKYLHQFEDMNVDVIPKVSVVSQTGWINNEFVYPCCKSKYQLDDIIKPDLESVYETSGTRASVIPVVLKIKQQPVANIVIGATLAAPLVHLLKCGNIAIHIYGLNGSGKSTLNQFAFSLFGNPNARGAIPTADATKVGLEYYFAGRHDLPAFIEDIHSISDFKTQALMSKLPYQFCNAEGRLRGTTKGNNQRMLEFRGSLITNSEKPLTSATSEGGSKRRVIELQTPNELFDLETVALIHDTMENHYGVLGSDWIKTIQLSTDYIKSVYSTIKPQLIQKYPEKIPKHLYSLAAIFTANKIFSELCMDEYDEATERKQLEEIIASLPDKTDIADYMRAKSLIIEWVLSHPQNFATDSNPDIKGYEMYGVIRDEYVAVFPMYLRQLLEQHNISPTTVIKQLADDGFILRDDGQVQKKISIKGQKLRVYCLNISSAE